MVVIKCTAHIPGEQFHRLANDLHAQAREGIVVLPYFCDLLAVSEGMELQIIQGKDGDRVAELEKELAAAMDYISRERPCQTCKHEPNSASPCETADWECNYCGNLECPCKACNNGSNWEWRGAYASV